MKIFHEFWANFSYGVHILDINTPDCVNGLQPLGKSGTALTLGLLVTQSSFRSKKKLEAVMVIRKHFSTWRMK